MDEYKVDGYKLHRERVPVGPNRLSCLIEVVAGAVAVLVFVPFCANGSGP